MRSLVVLVVLSLAMGVRPALAADPAQPDDPAQAALAPTPAAETEPPPAPIEDPLEPFNRGMFAIDLTINKLFAGKGRVLAMAKWIPVPVREGLYNAFNNLEEPDTLANDLLQRKLHKAIQTGGRFAINSTVGGLGVIDVASRMGLKRTREDFGQTLATWGITSGPYLFFPIVGPTTFRDALASPVDGLFLPGHWFPETTWERGGIKFVRLVVQPSTVGIRQVARGAAEAGDTDDEYATLRQLYFDQRADQIADRPNLADNPVAAFPERTRKKKPPSQPTKRPDGA
jgi:phospholipid-binding lipoprotein MlaA